MIIPAQPSISNGAWLPGSNSYFTHTLSPSPHAPVPAFPPSEAICILNSDRLIWPQAIDFLLGEREVCSNGHMEGRQFHLWRLRAGRVKGEVVKARLERRKAEVGFVWRTLWKAQLLGEVGGTALQWEVEVMPYTGWSECAEARMADGFHQSAKATWDLMSLMGAFEAVGICVGC